MVYAGSLVDEGFLAVPRVLSRLKPAPVTDREQFSEELDFYIQNGYTDNPQSFFTLPGTPAHWQIIEEKPFLHGKYQVITYESLYQIKNPMVQERFDMHRENRTGYLIRLIHGDHPEKTVLCLHGYLLGEPGQAMEMFRMKKLFSMGLNVALFITPFHYKRAASVKKPGNHNGSFRKKALEKLAFARSSFFRRGIFIQPEDPAMTAECFGQAMHDLASVIRILKDTTATEVGLAGASLGGYLAGIYACLSADIAFSAMMVPAVKMTRPYPAEKAKLPFPVDDELAERIRKVWDFYSPLHMMPAIPKDRILIAASKGDRLCPFPHTKALWEKWGKPPHVFLTGGHWLISDNERRGMAWYSFLQRVFNL